MRCSALEHKIIMVKCHVFKHILVSYWVSSKRFRFEDSPSEYQTKSVNKSGHSHMIMHMHEINRCNTEEQMEF